MNCTISRLQSRIVDIFKNRKYTHIEVCQLPINTFVVESIKQKKKASKRESLMKRESIKKGSIKKASRRKPAKENKSSSVQTEVQPSAGVDNDANNGGASNPISNSISNSNSCESLESEGKNPKHIHATSSNNGNETTTTPHQKQQQQQQQNIKDSIVGFMETDYRTEGDEFDPSVSSVSGMSTLSLNNYNGPWVIVKARHTLPHPNTGLLKPNAFETRTIPVWVILHHSSDTYKSTISIDHVRQYIEFISENHLPHVFIASPRPLTGQGEIELNAYKLKENQAGRYFDWECFQLANLTIEIEKHVLVPEHIVLSEEEKQHELVKHKLKFESLIDIETNDPIACLLHIPQGVMVKLIYRKSDGSQHVEFRKSSDSDANTVEMTS